MIAPSLQHPVFPQALKLSNTLPSTSWEGRDVELSSSDCLGALWGIALIVHSGQLFSRKQPFYLENKKTFLNIVGVVGSTANTVSWIAKMSRASLEPVAQYIKTLGYGASAIASAMTIAEDVAALREAETMIKRAANGEERSIGKHKKNNAIIALVAKVAALAWAVLGILSLFPFVYIPGALLGGLLMVSFIFGFFGVFYKVHVNILEKRHG